MGKSVHLVIHCELPKLRAIRSTIWMRYKAFLLPMLCYNIYPIILLIKDIHYLKSVIKENKYILMAKNRYIYISKHQREKPRIGQHLKATIKPTPYIFWQGKTGLRSLFDNKLPWYTSSILLTYKWWRFVVSVNVGSLFNISDMTVLL